MWIPEKNPVLETLESYQMDSSEINSLILKHPVRLFIPLPSPRRNWRDHIRAPRPEIWLFGGRKLKRDISVDVTPSKTCYILILWNRSLTNWKWLHSLWHGKGQNYKYFSDLLGVFIVSILTNAIREKNIFSESIFENIDTTNIFKIVQSLCLANSHGKRAPISGSRRHPWVPSYQRSHTALRRKQLCM